MSESRAFANAMAALQKKSAILEEENKILHSQLKSCQYELQKLVEELSNQENIFETLEKKLKNTISQLEEELLKKDEEILQKDAQIESLSQELHQSLIDQSRIMDQQLSDRQQLSEQQEQIEKLKQVIHKLKEPRKDDVRFTQSEKKTSFVSKLDNAVEQYFNNENQGYEQLIRRISKLEKEIKDMENEQSNKILLDQKIQLLKELQEQEESLLQYI
ncbi:unnamed protein product [Paramecium pentaurelia]|uniref:Uncharacterized protein n=1 Tax=Paramecium pentaurelia TaxID=43138 RepID=A0A8S1SEM8_9CILI|nr:unnamed protein product [Paramecium pentaurelia]